jgi:hypothetical protein
MTRVLAVLGFVATALVQAVLPASANDTTAEMGTGGLVLGRSDAVSMVSEDLFISMTDVRVNYVFRNITDKDVDTIVAFPMPDIVFSDQSMVAIPQDTADNFLGFSVTVDGLTLEPELQQQAFANGLNVTDLLVEAGLPLQPYTDAGQAALQALSAEKRDELMARGVVMINEYDVGEGMKPVTEPAWTLKSTYWWRMMFAAGADVQVSHSYKPSVGGTAGITFLAEYDDDFSQRNAYKRDYCTDADFLSTVEKRHAESIATQSTYYTEARIQYVLRTGANWASTIENFKLTVDKGSADNLVSFCGKDVVKTGPTTFEMQAKDFWPEKDLNILIIIKSTL